MTCMAAWWLWLQTSLFPLGRLGCALERLRGGCALSASLAHALGRLARRLLLLNAAALSVNIRVKALTRHETPLCLVFNIIQHFAGK